MKKLIFAMFFCLCAYSFAIGIGMIGANGTGTSVSPSHAYLDPNGDVSTDWDVKNGPSNYEDIDGGVRSPSVPPTAGQYVNRVYLETPATGDDVYDMEAAPSGSTTTAIKISVYGNIWPGSAISVDLNIGGSWQGASSLGFVDYTSSWKSTTFSGSWSEAQVNAMQVKLLKTAGASTYCVIYALNAYITYTD